MLGVEEVVIGRGVDRVVGGLADVAVVAMVEAGPEAVPGDRERRPQPPQLAHQQPAHLFVALDAAVGEAEEDRLVDAEHGGRLALFLLALGGELLGGAARVLGALVAVRRHQQVDLPAGPAEQRHRAGATEVGVVGVGDHDEGAPRVQIRDQFLDVRGRRVLGHGAASTGCAASAAVRSRSSEA